MLLVSLWSLARLAHNGTSTIVVTAMLPPTLSVAVGHWNPHVQYKRLVQNQPYKEHPEMETAYLILHVSQRFIGFSWSPHTCKMQAVLLIDDKSIKHYQPLCGKMFTWLGATVGHSFVLSQLLLGLCRARMNSSSSSASSTVTEHDLCLSASWFASMILLEWVFL